MTPDEKTAIQMVLLQELADRQKEQPSLLLDVLLSNQGPQWVWRTLSTRHAQAAQSQQAMEHLLKAIRGPEQEETAA